VIIAAGECLRDAHSDCSRMQIGGVRHRSIIRLLRPIEPICWVRPRALGGRKQYSFFVRS
jgi:hypothetical protein